MTENFRIQPFEDRLAQCLVRDRLEITRRITAWREAGISAPELESRLRRLLPRLERSERIVARRRNGAPQVSYPATLPITDRREELVAAIRENRVLIVAGETGSGKTTQLPKMCLEAGRGILGRIGCTQPRRVAAQSISRRLAEELDVSWGREVGSKVRFTDKTSRETYIKLMTDGILLAEIQSDPWLGDYDTIIIDEAHERSLNIDFLLGYFQLLMERRADLKLIITSATIDTEAFSRAFGGAPVIEVSGRVFPVEVMYLPMDEAMEDSGETTYVDGAVQAVETILGDPGDGDILVFMPTERDIRETRELLEGRLDSARNEVVPLFGRLTNTEQQRVFSPGSRRRIIVATNIAETSLTLPRIRYVVDSGLARISRYTARTHTQRLPIEPVSQSSANQRKGRCGRMRDGVCIRLYSEADFEARPQFTQPEIQRANLAEVLLRMKAFHLGEIETFPFLDPPKPHAIRGAYQLLQELGAIDDECRMTQVGEELARLPIDPTIGRMILQARNEKAVSEVAVIAAGLSIMDPRERPLEKESTADAMHRRFLDEQSDFLTLLNIWNAYHDEWERLKTQNQLRKFCKSHFLSYIRLREWRDIHHQIEQALHDLGGIEFNSQPAGYAAVHRAVLTGLLIQVGKREDANRYRMGGGRESFLFPGSVVFDKKNRYPKPNKGRKDSQSKASRGSQPEWIVAGELVETTRHFARIVAGIQPEWIAELGAHLCRFSHHNPHWNLKAERVVANERVTLNGLLILERRKDFQRVDPQAANEIFIRDGLMSGDLDSRYGFLQHNRRVFEKAETIRTRIRHRSLHALESTLAEFYARHLPGIASIPALNRRLRREGRKNPQFLHLTEEELDRESDLNFDREDFPDAVEIGNTCLPIHYAYAPGEDRDGATVRLPASLAHALSPSAVLWLIPGQREEVAMQMLRSLPKSLRRELMPLTEKARAIAKNLQPEHDSLEMAFSRYLHQHFGTSIPASVWRRDQIPQYLLPRLEIVDPHGQIVGAGRNLESLRQSVEQHDLPYQGDAWQKAARIHEKYHLTTWNFDDLPERIEICTSGALPVFAWPGLQCEKNDIHLRLFSNAKEAAVHSRTGFRRLCAGAMQKDLAWMRKDLRALKRLAPLYAPLGSFEVLETSAWQCLEDYLFEVESILPLCRRRYEATLAQARSRMPGLVPEFLNLLENILNLRQKAGLNVTAYPDMQNDLQRLVPPDFPAQYLYPRLKRLPVYLNAMLIRAERARLNPAKDQSRARQLDPFLQAWNQLQQLPDSSRPRREFRWMLEEFRISLFAQELGTQFPVSPKRLNEALARCHQDNSCIDNRVR